MNLPECNQNKEAGLNKVTMGSFDMKEFVL